MYRTITSLLQPDTLLFCATAFGLAILWWKRRESVRRLLLVTVPFVLLWLACTPLVTHLAARTLSNQYPPLAAPPADAEAIVVLSGCAHAADARGYAPQLCSDTLSRCFQGLQLHRQSGLPIVVTGGIVKPSREIRSLGSLMRDFFVQAGIPPQDIIVEERSTTTYENAIECAKLDAQFRHIVLVTDDRHMPRAAGCFRRAGFKVVAAPVRTDGGDLELSPLLLIPTTRSASQLQATMHEWLGLVWYKLHGRI
jgi:uncharacterized SAM-binding protein YcdF (DUF218 family)